MNRFFKRLIKRFFICYIICLSIVLLFILSMPFFVKGYLGFSSYIDHIIFLPIFAGLGIFFGETYRRFVMPDISLAYGLQGKVFWLTIPQCLGLLIGNMMFAGFMQIIGGQILPSINIVQLVATIEKIADQTKPVPVENANLTSATELLTSSEQTAIKVKHSEEVVPSIDTNTPQTDKSNNIVMGRCYMGSCWWWKVEKTENIQAQNQETLLKVYVRTTSVEYPDSEIEKDGYPDSPSKQAQWENVKEVFVLCSKKFPTYIQYDEEKKKFIGTIPFDRNNTTLGVTEGIGNLYLHICNVSKEVKFEISSESGLLETTLEKPTDIFNHPKQQVETQPTTSSTTAIASDNTSQSEASQQISDSQTQTEETPKTAEDHIKKMLNGAITDDGIGIQTSKQYLESLPKPAKGDKKAADEINKEALKFIKKQQYDQAAPLLEKASQIDPSDVETLNNYGFSLMMSNNLEQAETVLVKTLIMKPDRASAWSNLGYTFALQGKEQLAVASYLNTYRFSKNPKKTLQIFEKQLAQESNAKLKNALTKAVDEINTDYD